MLEANIIKILSAKSGPAAALRFYVRLTLKLAVQRCDLQITFGFIQSITVPESWEFSAKKRWPKVIDHLISHLR